MFLVMAIGAFAVWDTPWLAAISNDAPAQRTHKISFTFDLSPHLIMRDKFLRLSRARSHVPLTQSQGPLDRFKVHFLNSRIIPGGDVMAKGGIEHTALTVSLCPRQREIAIRTIDPRFCHVQLTCVES